MFKKTKKTTIHNNTIYKNTKTVLSIYQQLYHHSTINQFGSFQFFSVDLIIVPGVTGEYGITAGHTPIISELKPGLVQIYHAQDDEPEKYFVSGGFAFTHANSVTDVTAVEAFKLDDLDADAVRAGLISYKAAMDAATPETQDHALAQIGFETHEAMADALGISA